MPARHILFYVAARFLPADRQAAAAAAARMTGGESSALWDPGAALRGERFVEPRPPVQLPLHWALTICVAVGSGAFSSLRPTRAALAVGAEDARPADAAEGEKGAKVSAFGWLHATLSEHLAW